jgi:hypothetical protein
VLIVIPKERIATFGLFQTEHVCKQVIVIFVMEFEVDEVLVEVFISYGVIATLKNAYIILEII